MIAETPHPPRDHAFHQMVWVVVVVASRLPSLLRRWLPGDLQGSPRCKTGLRRRGPVIAHFLHLHLHRQGHGTPDGGNSGSDGSKTSASSPYSKTRSSPPKSPAQPIRSEASCVSPSTTASASVSVSHRCLL